MASKQKPGKKTGKQSDGFRSADQSGIPVPSRLMLIEYLSDIGQPATFRSICRHFSISGKEAKASLNGRLERLQKQGVVLVDRRNRYALPDKMGAFTGRVIGHANGFGFVRPDQGGEDLYLHHRQMRKVLHGDRVVAKLKNIDARGRKEGVIVEVVVDPDREIVGHYQFEGGVGFVEPDDTRFGRDIAIPNEHTGNAQSGDIVVVRILRHPVQHHHAVGRICHIHGPEQAPGLETEIAIRKHEIPVEWPEEVETQLERHGRTFRSARLTKGRQDIRDLPLVTIDGADARDFDDAVYCRSNRRGWRLVVAIADVSHYVKPSSPLDHEAYRRGNSVYFPNRVIPMLPELLSNGICSLNPGEDRCCMVCDMQVSRAGKVLEYEFYPGLMHSAARLTYGEMSKIVDKRDRKARKNREKIVPHLDQLHRLYLAMATQRDKRGAVNFEFPEPYIHFDEQQRIDRITVRERNVAHKIIEECMLAANVCAGELIADHFDDSGLYRNHEGPDAEALEDLRAFLKGIGLYLGGEESPDASDYARLLQQVTMRPAVSGVVQTVLLRSLSQAVYSPDQIGHFALGYAVYSHFTSPIRRYPDLVVHRLIRNIIDGKKRKVAPYDFSMSEVGEHCSFTERRAEDATRDVIAWLKAEFMQDKIGEVFDGVISGVKEFGVFVQLDHIFVDGLVHVTSLGSDYFRFDPLHFELVGERNGRRFRLGDPIRIVVSQVNLDLARIDFELADTPPGKGGRGSRSSRAGTMAKALEGVSVTKADKTAALDEGEVGSRATTKPGKPSRSKPKSKSKVRAKVKAKGNSSGSQAKKARAKKAGKKTGQQPTGKTGGNGKRAAGKQTKSRR